MGDNNVEGELLTPDAWENARIVAEDLEYLADSSHPSLDERQLRRDSPILRRLLLNGDYSRAWRDLGLQGHPVISAPELAASLGQSNRDYIQFATVPASPAVTKARSKGGELKMPVLSDTLEESTNFVTSYNQQGGGLMFASIPPRVISATAAFGQSNVASAYISPGPRRMVSQPVPKFLSSSFALVLGTELSRQEVIQYVANKLGGAHFDVSRNRKNDNRLTVLDKFAGTHLDISGLKPIKLVYIELLSIIEYLAQSHDALRLRQAFGNEPYPS